MESNKNSRRCGGNLSGALSTQCELKRYKASLIEGGTLRGSSVSDNKWCCWRCSVVADSRSGREAEDGEDGGWRTRTSEDSKGRQEVIKTSDRG